MPKIGEIPPEVTLAPGESIEFTFDASSDVGVIHGDRGTRYAFSVRLTDGRTAVIKGGKRLLTAIQNAVGTANGSMRLRVKATGNAGSLDRQWTAEKVG